MKILAIASLLILAATPVNASAQAAVQTGGYDVSETGIGTLLDDPVAKAVVDKHLPGFSANPQIDMARSMTLKSVQQYSPDTVTDKALADIQADLTKLPAKK
jgi:hypothetical protein